MIPGILLIGEYLSDGGFRGEGVLGASCRRDQEQEGEGQGGEYGLHVCKDWESQEDNRQCHLERAKASRSESEGVD